MATDRDPLCFGFHFNRNVKLAKNGFCAIRIDQFRKSLTFSNRPLFLNELVSVKISATSSNWKGFTRMGVTYENPKILRQNFENKSKNETSLPPGVNYLMARIADTYCRPQNVLNFKLEESGNLLFDVNGIADEGVLIFGLDVSRPVWLVAELDGVTTSIEFVGFGADEVKLLKKLPKCEMNSPKSFEIELKILTNNFKIVNQTKIVEEDEFDINKEIDKWRFTRFDEFEIKEEIDKLPLITFDDRESGYCVNKFV